MTSVRMDESVLLVNDYFAKAGPGGHYRIQGVAKGLRRMGKDVVLLSPDGIYTGLSGIPDTKPTGAAFRCYWRNTLPLFRRLRTINARRFVFEIPFPALKAFAAMLRRGSAPVHLDVGDYWLESRFWLPQRLLDWCITQAASSALGISVATHALLDFFLQAGLDRDSIHYLPCSVDLSLFDMGTSRRRHENREFTLVYSGRVSKEQGCEMLIPILSAVTSQIPEANLLIIGGGDYMSQLLEDASRSDLRNHITTAGPVPQSAIPDLLARSQVGLCLEPPTSPSSRGTFPQKVSEYMAMGCIPVMTPIPEAPYLVTPGRSGLILRYGDMPSHIIDLVGDDSDLRRMSREAREVAEREFDLDRNVNRLWEFWLHKESGRSEV